MQLRHVPRLARKLGERCSARADRGASFCVAESRWFRYHGVVNGLAPSVTVLFSLNHFHNMPKFLSDRGGFDLIALFLLLLGLLGLGASSLYEKLANSTPRPRLTTTDPLDLTTGFADWAFCSHEQRVESHPNWLRRKT